jgi:hypothetical protein
MVYNTPSGWSVVFDSRRVGKELEAMAADIRADFAHLVELIEKYGLNNLHEPQISSI